MCAKKLLNILLITLLSITLISCGDIDDEKLEKNVDNLIEEYTELGNDLSSQSPSLNWNDSELTAYSKKINKFEQVYNELMRLDSKHGNVVINGNYSTNSFIQMRRSEVNYIRREQNRLEYARLSQKEKEGKVDALFKFNKAKLRKNIMNANEIINNSDYEMDSTYENISALRDDISSLENIEHSIKKLVRKLDSSQSHNVEHGLALDYLLAEADDVLGKIEGSLRFKKAQTSQLVSEL